MPGRSIPRLANVATPPTAFTVAGPESAPALGLVPIAIVTAFLASDTRLPNASSIATWTLGLIGVIGGASQTVPGWVVKTRCIGAAGVTAKGALMAGLNSLPLLFDSAKRVNWLPAF